MICKWILFKFFLVLIQIQLATIILEIRINMGILVLVYSLILFVLNQAYVKLFSLLTYNLIAQFINFWFWFFDHLYFIFLFFSNSFTDSFGSPHLFKIIQSWYWPILVKDRFKLWTLFFFINLKLVWWLARGCSLFFGIL